MEKHNQGFGEGVYARLLWTRLFLVGVVWGIALPTAWTDTVRLKNGDTLTGEIVLETEKSISIAHEALGTVEIKKEFIVEPANKQEDAAQAVKKGYEWQRKLSGGYSHLGGNTRLSKGAVSLGITGKSEKAEWTGKINAEYAVSQEKMNARKFYGLLRYAHSLEEKNQWYYFQKLEGDQDYFANIDYRLIPSGGIGYWFANTDSWKMMLETAVGYEYTDFKDDAKNSQETKLIPRFFGEKAVLKNLSLNQEFVFYPSLRDEGEYRFRSQTGLVNKINQHCDWAVRFLDEYNSMPAGHALKNDYKVVSSIDYVF